MTEISQDKSAAKQPEAEPSSLRVNQIQNL